MAEGPTREAMVNGILARARENLEGAVEALRAQPVQPRALNRVADCLLENRWNEARIKLGGLPEEQLHYVYDVFCKSMGSHAP